MRRFRWMAILSLIGLSGGGCGEGVFGRAGLAALEAEVTNRDGAITVTRVRGPARFRWLSSTRFAIGARFLRPDAGGTRRGDLKLEIVLPFSPDATGRFFGSPQSLSATYTESSPGQSSGVVLEGQGSIRLEMFFGSGIPSVRAAVALDFRTSPDAGPVESTRLSGVIVTGTQVETGEVSLTDLGVGLWSDTFDPYVAYQAPDLDYLDYVSEASYDDFVWATESTPSGGDYGDFSFDPYTFDGEYGFPGDGFDYSDFEGVDPVDGDIPTVSDCGGGEYQEEGSEGYGCSGGGDESSYSGCEGAGSEDAGGCEPSGSDAPDCQGVGDECATVTRGPPRTLLMLVFVLLGWRWLRRRRVSKNRPEAS